MPPSPPRIDPQPDADGPVQAGQAADVAQTAARLVPLFYADLLRMARRIRRAGGAGETLQTTVLVHETFLKLQGSPDWQDRQHFLCAAALAMRQVLVDDLRRRLAQRRGGGAQHLPLEAADGLATPEGDEQVLAMDAALVRLSAVSPRLVRTVECRFFAGYSEAETAEALGVSVATVQRDWTKARAWLQRELG